MFKQRRLEINEITEHLIPIFEQLQKNNPELQILLTVSPVRYFGQGALASQTNKATLLLACEKLTNKFDWISYFPSYEIMMDELRDYRFYQDDMIHPSPLAVNYIWERFCETYFTKETNKIIPQVIKLRKALEHKPLHADSKSYNDFIMHREETIKKLKAKYPYINI